MMKFRVLWTDSKTGEACGLDVSTMHQAYETAKQMARNPESDRVQVAAFHPQTFNELVVSFK